MGTFDSQVRGYKSDYGKRSEKNIRTFYKRPTLIWRDSNQEAAYRSFAELSLETSFQNCFLRQGEGFIGWGIRKIR